MSNAGMIEADEVRERNVPKNATIVDAEKINPSENDLNELLRNASSHEEPVVRRYGPSKMNSIEEQLSAAPKHNDYHYVRYRGDIIQITTNYPR